VGGIGTSVLDGVDQSSEFHTNLYIDCSLLLDVIPDLHLIGCQTLP
jgi:hypothetical protein